MKIKQGNPNFCSYFGDFNNNYYEIKGISSIKKERNEEEEENEQDNLEDVIKNMINQ